MNIGLVVSVRQQQARMVSETVSESEHAPKATRTVANFGPDHDYE